MMLSNDQFMPIWDLDLAPIKAKLMHTESGEGWTLEQVNLVEIEYRRFLFLMKKFPHEQTAPLVHVDTFWHYHILDTAKYAADCETVFGYFLHHFPYIGMRGEADEEALRQIGDRMRVLYEETFGESYVRASAAPTQSDPACSETTAKPAFCGVTVEPAFCGVTAEPAFCGVTAKPAFCGVTAKPAFCGVTAKPAFCGVTAKPAFCGVTAKPAFCGVTAKGGVTLKPAFCGVTLEPASLMAGFGTATATPAFCGVTTKPAFCGITAKRAHGCATESADAAPLDLRLQASQHIPDLYTERPSLAPA